MDHFDNWNILTDKQHGFRSRRSCESQLIITIDALAKSLAKGEQVDVILLDFSKTFDKVPHHRLLHKLDYYGVRGNTWKWVQDFLNKRTQKVLLDGVTSSCADVISRVPQGTVMGPLLFLTFINDLPEHTTSDVRLFADDCLLYRHIRNDEDAAALQNDLTSLQQWEETWQMQFHPQKCNVIHVTNKRKSITHSYKLHDHIREVMENSKYLGVTINNKLNWTQHITNIKGKASRTLGFLQRNLGGCKSNVKSTAYTTMVRPTLEYAGTVWEPHHQVHIRSLEGVQRRAARFVSGNFYDRTPGCVTAMINQLKWEPLEYRRLTSRLVMFYKITHDLIDINAPSYLLPGDARTRGANRYRQPATDKDIYKFSFFPRTTTDWNRLPETTTSANTIESFRMQLSSSQAAYFTH
jgi:hypothetical protein